MPIFSLKCFRTDTQVARNRVRGFGLLKPHTVPARIVSPLSGAFSTLSAFQVESVEQPWAYPQANSDHGYKAPELQTRSVPGLFNAHWTPLYERLTVGSMAAIQRARAMFSAPLARAMLSTELRSLAMMPGLIRMRLASSARVTSRT